MVFSLQGTPKFRTRMWTYPARVPAVLRSENGTWPHVRTTYTSAQVRLYHLVPSRADFPRFELRLEVDGWCLLSGSTTHSYDLLPKPSRRHETSRWIRRENNASNAVPTRVWFLGLCKDHQEAWSSWFLAISRTQSWAIINYDGNELELCQGGSFVGLFRNKPRRPSGRRCSDPQQSRAKRSEGSPSWDFWGRTTKCSAVDNYEDDFNQSWKSMPAPSNYLEKLVQYTV